VKGLAGLDATLRDRISRHVQQFKGQAVYLDKYLPPLPFTVSQPASFLYGYRLRMLIRDGGTLKENDGLDFSHAIMGAAFSHLVALDGRWKHLVHPPLSRMHSPPSTVPKLDNLVSDLGRAIPLKAS
jgi:hypothetical protein